MPREVLSGDNEAKSGKEERGGHRCADATAAVKVDWVSARGIRGEVSANGDTLSRGNSRLRFFERCGKLGESLKGY